jgi:hypothetical protein
MFDRRALGLALAPLVGLLLLEFAPGDRRAAARDAGVPVAASTGAASSPQAASSTAGDEFFEKQVRPVLVASCYPCHSAGAKELKGSLRLDRRDRAMKGGEGGVVLVPGKPEESRLITAIGYQNPDLQMPPKTRLAENQIAALTTWVRMGAPWPETGSGEVAFSSTGAADGPRKPVFNLGQRKAAHWAWQPIHAEAPPVVRHPAWAQQPLDRFLLARWEAAGLEPPALAERRVLIRRAYFDLIGLPPKPEEIDAVIRDTSPQAWPEFVDRLLASPQFGERWARHWLDLVRYAETRGHEYDYEISNAWQYRDYVIRAFNTDLPYDQFVREQIAGDLLRRPRLGATGRVNESVIGTGFWFLGEWLHSPVDIRQDELDRIDNQIDVLGKTFLGLTIGCARCHDHKFDAISSNDYYSLAGFLESSSFRDVRFEWQAQNHAVVEQIAALDAAMRPKVLAKLAGDVSPRLDRLADYLLAAREATAATAKEHGDVQKSIAELAARRKLNAAALARWIELIRQARKQSADPLYAWAVLSDETWGEDSPLNKLPVFQKIAADWRNVTARDAGGAATQFSPGSSVVVEYGHLTSGGWLTDGLAFGDGPAQAGQIVLAPEWLDKPERAATVLDASCAHSRLVGPNLPGMLRTPEFTITARNIFVRMQGAADVFGVVDSHRMVAGPLHGATKWHADAGTEWKWISHDLGDYIGQRCHLEFTPVGHGTPLAVAEVVQSPSGIPDASRENTFVAASLARSKSLTLNGLAEQYERLFREAAEDLASDHLRDRPDSDSRAALANWILENLSESSVIRPENAASSELTKLMRDYRRQRGDLLRQIRPSATAMAMLDGNGVDDHVMLRGNWHTPGEPAPRRFLEAISGTAQPAIGRDGSGRLELAQRILNPHDPLPARVMANRVWQHLFGRGIVASVDNFGVMGQKPTDPALLDYLAESFRSNGWSIKRLVREIMLSSAYQMSSRESAADRERDPQNLLLHHRTLRRLEGEAIRDEMLSISGRLDAKMFGPPVPVFLTPFMEGKGRPNGGPLDGAGRRSIYIAVRRNFLSPMMTAFDMPHPEVTVGDRGTSNVPAQALIMLNDPLVAELSHVWARKLLADKDESPRERVARMYREALARAPDETELNDALDFVRSQSAELGIKPPDRSAEEKVWADLAQVLFNVKEFIYIE